MAPKRRNRLIPKGGIECFEIRAVTSINADGEVVTETEITTPDSTDYPALGEVLGAVELAKVALLNLYSQDADV